MKNWKRILSVLLAVVLVGTMVSGIALAAEKTKVKVPIKTIEVKEDYKKWEVWKGDTDDLYSGTYFDYDYDWDIYDKIDPEKEEPDWDDLQWSSSDSSVVLVDKAGTYKARKAGKATITVASKFNSSVKDTFEFEVKAGKPVTSVSLSTTTFEVAVDEKVDLEDFATYEPDIHGDIDISLQSSDPEIVSVSGTRVKGLKAGTATVTYTVTNEDGSSVSTTATVTVTEKALKSLKFSKSSITYDKFEKDADNEPISLWDYLTIDPENADQTNLKWESSNEKVARVNNGTVWVYRPGTSTITVTAKANPKIKAEIEVKVLEGEAIDQLKFDEKSVTLYFIKKDGKSDDDRTNKYVSFDVQPSAAEETIKNVAWTTSDANVALAHSEGKTSTSARIQAVGKGKCTITARVTDTSGNTYTASVKVKVKEKSATAKLNKTEITLRAGKKKTLKATDADSKVKLEGKWSSSDKSVAKVNKKTGKVTAVGEGRAIITFKPTNKAYKSVTCVVNVKPAE